MMLPVLIASAGCASEATVNGLPDVVGVMNPRPLEARTQVDRILQVAKPEVDVLWVLSDLAGGLDDKLVQHFPSFFDFFEDSDLDFHIGAVRTNMEELNPWSGRLITVDGFRYLDPDTPDAESVFAEVARVATDSGGYDRGNDATYAALETEKNDYNLGFLRERSGVHIIVISDEIDRSTITPEQLAAYLNGLRSNPDDVTHSSITVSSPELPYPQVTQKVGGIVRDIYDPDWTGVLEDLGMLAAGLKREYFLSRLPVPGTIEVTVTDGGTTLEFDEGEDWAYNPVRNSITFYTYVPEHLAEVVLEYEPLASHHGA